MFGLRCLRQVRRKRRLGRSYKTPDKPEQVAEVLKYFDWAYKSGDKLASDLDYVPLPDKVSDQVRQVWSKDIKGKDGKPLFAAKGS